MATSEFIYINAPLPASYQPPVITGHQVLTAEELRDLLTSNDVTVEAAAGDTVPERLLSIFQHPEVLFGNPDYIPENRAHWLERFEYFVQRDEPIAFIAMAFPYKVPNPLKNGQRRAPDLGEALMLRRFAAVLDAVRAVYPPGARLTILEEGILGRCQGVDPRDIAAYRAGIRQIADLAGVGDAVAFHSLDDMVERIPNFEARWYFEQERLRRLWDEGDAYLRHGYDETTPGQRASIPTRDYNPDTLAKAYDPSQTDSALRYVRQYLEFVAHRQFFAYRGLLNLRDTTGYLEEIAPAAIKLTVSPKPTNLAVLPVNRASGILPYHGAPVRDLAGQWTVQYYGSLGSLGDLTALHLDGDADQEPIGFSRTQA
ncbi:MAG: L-tyrosine/L-tryptophan isonitrile synthase family protein [Propionicimonas sp.]|nr:L-tyrosine/L-tryptophan isonitrile synthase family protein [Propionicimonas sp.]